MITITGRDIAEKIQRYNQKHNQNCTVDYFRQANSLVALGAGLFHSRVRSPKVKAITLSDKIFSDRSTKIHMLTLIPFLKKVNDPRKKLGQRHPLWLILLLVVLGLMFGYLGYRYLETFAKSNQKLIVKTFHLTIDRVPSYSTIRRVMLLIKTSDLVESFNQWASHFATPNDLTDWVSIDGKSLRSTCKNSDNSSQNFVSIVSLYQFRLHRNDILKEPQECNEDKSCLNASS
jgi:hypothetical protein